MATPDTQHDSISAGRIAAGRTAGIAPELRVDTTTEKPPRSGYSLDRIFYICGAIAGVGFLVTLFGAYVTPNLAAILAGTIIIIVGVVAWIVTALLMTAIMVKSLLGRGGGSP